MSSKDAFYGASLGKEIYTPIIFLIIAPLALSGYGIDCLKKAIDYHRQISKGLAHKAELLSGKHGSANAKI